MKATKLPSEKDLTILRTISQFKLATTKQIEDIHFNDGTNNQQRTCRNCLNRLVRLKLIVRLDRKIGGSRAGSAAYIYSLAAKGLKLAPNHSPKTYSREPSLLFLEHTLAITQLYSQLYKLTRAYKLNILDVQTEPTCWRIINGSYLPIVLKPDLYLKLKVNNIECFWFIEIDRSTVHKAAMNKKLDIYYQAYRTGGEALIKDVFPQVLWLVLDEPRKDWLQQLVVPYNKLVKDLFVIETKEKALEILIKQISVV